MEGGRFIGKGSYGCVFSPPLKCRKKQLSTVEVGKITDSEDAKREYNAHKILGKINEAKELSKIKDAYTSSLHCDAVTDIF